MYTYIITESTELHETCMVTILLYLRMFPQAFTEYLLHTGTHADGQKFTQPSPGAMPSLLVLGAKGRIAELLSYG